MLTGLIFIILGAAFLLKNLGLISGSAWGVIWPLIFVAIGVGILLKKDRASFFWEERFGWRKKGMRSKTTNASESTNIINEDEKLKIYE